MAGVISHITVGNGDSRRKAIPNWIFRAVAQKQIEGAPMSGMNLSTSDNPIFVEITRKIYTKLSLSGSVI